MNTMDFQVLVNLWKVVSMNEVETDSAIKVGDIVGISKIEFTEYDEILFEVVKNKTGERDDFHLDEIKTMMGNKQMKGYYID